jgi:hypothetical protein
LRFAGEDLLQPPALARLAAAVEHDLDVGLLAQRPLERLEEGDVVSRDDDQLAGYCHDRPTPG